MSLRTREIIQYVLVGILSVAIFVWWITGTLEDIRQETTSDLLESLEGQQGEFENILEEGREYLASSTEALERLASSTPTTTEEMTP